MRPRELTLRGFRSFHGEATFQWQRRGLVGIVGPIGSGKSSILDAISFALYGRTPRLGSGTKALINQRSDSAHVALEFEVDSSLFRAVRVVRRGGASQHTLYRLEAEAETVMTDKASEMNEAVERLLGLGFDAFRRSVLLAQNQFAAFLESTHGERNAVLRGVFGFDRLDEMRDVTRGRLHEVGGRLAGLETRRQTAENDRVELDRYRTDLAMAQARVEMLEGLRRPVQVLAEQRAAAEKDLEGSSADLERLRALAVPEGDRVAALLAAATAGEQRFAAAEDRLAKAKAAAAEAETARDAALESVGGEKGLEAAADAVRRFSGAAERAAVLAAEAEAAEAEAKAAGDSAAAAAEAATKAESLEAAACEEAVAAEAAVEAARGRLHEAHTAGRVAALRSELLAGEPCPVCNQAVTTLPAPVHDPGVGAVEAELVRAEEAARVASRSADEASRNAATRKAESKAAQDRAAEVEERAGAARARLEEAKVTVEATRAAVPEVLGGSDPEAALVRFREGVDAASAALRAANSEVEDAAEGVESGRRESEEAKQRMVALATEVAGVAGALGLEVSPGSDPDSVEAALIAVREGLAAALSDAVERREAAASRIAEIDAERGRLLESVDLAAGDDLVEVIASASREATAADAAIGLIEKRLGELTALAAEEETLVATREVLERLHSDLAPSKFLEFVLALRRRMLADLAGIHFETLSGGRYRFSDDGAFDVVDLNAAEAVRGPASLSGGETFLASLAMALALAEIVAREGGRLDAFFLDEGFGSLDDEHLGLAMDGIERLVADGSDRLVVVVSHVPAMMERIEDLVRLDRDALTGDTVVVGGAGVPS